MTLTKGYTDELKALQDHGAIGSVDRELLSLILPRLNKHINMPLRMFATHPTADSVLNIGSNQVELGDGAKQTTGPADDLINVFPATTIDFSDGSTGGGTVNLEGGSFSLPSTTTGNYRRLAISYMSEDNKLDCIFSAEAASVGALTNPGELFASLEGAPVGYIDLEAWDNGGSTAFKTAGSSTNIIENKVGSDPRIFRFGSGSGTGAGGDTSFKLQSLSGTTVKIKKGKYELGDGRILATGNITSDSPEDIDIDLSSVESSPSASTTYWLCVDLEQLGSQVTLSDTGQTVYPIYQASQFKVLTDAHDSINSQRYIPIGTVKTGGSAAWTDATLETAPYRVHSALSAFLPAFENKHDTHSSASTKTVTHGLSGAPQVISLKFWDNSESTFTPLEPSNYVTDITDSDVDFDFSALTFDTDDYVDIRLHYIPSLGNYLVSQSHSFKSQWFEDTSTTTLAHGLTDMDDIADYEVQEWDTSTGRRRNIDKSGLVQNFDGTNFYLDWTGLTPSATLKYRVVTGGTALPHAMIYTGNEFEFTDGSTLTSSSTAYPCSRMQRDYPISIRAIQKTSNGWQNVDTIGSLVWVTDDSNKYLQGDISSLSPSSSNPVKIFVE